MTLSDSQKLEFIENGFLVVRNAVPQELISRALRSINSAMGASLDEGRNGFQSGSYVPDLCGSPVITDLVNATNVFPMVESLVGEGYVAVADRGQIALRFPMFTDDPPPLRGHIDGQWGKNPEVPVGDFGPNFTVLVGVMLSELSEQYAGNFTVWPATHELYAKHFQKHGADAFLKGIRKIASPPPIQIEGKSGDTIFAHSLLAHCAAPNLAQSIRYALFFRMKSKTRDRFSGRRLTDPWVDFKESKFLQGRGLQVSEREVRPPEE
jgi:ectoine hydroxylase-related dioxygenase (phytanoyl-CoA dioxygenase family)